jgi:8-oxo-dGTP diphosphatase
MSEHEEINVSVDIVVFGHDNGDTSILLIKRKNDPFKGQWALPGGFVEADETLMQSAIRELKEETGIELTDLEQVGVFDDPKRDPRKRVISIAHYTSVEKNKFVPKGADDAEDAKWFSLDQLPSLAFDHAKILEAAKTKLKEKEISE